MSNERVARFNKQHFIVGLKQTLKALKRGQITSLIIAKDVEICLLAQVFSWISHKSTPITYFKSKSALGKTVGVDVNTTVVALLNKS